MGEPRPLLRGMGGAGMSKEKPYEVGRVIYRLYSDGSMQLEHQGGGGGVKQGKTWGVGCSSRPHTCPVCSGNRWVPDYPAAGWSGTAVPSKTCKVCDGTGVLWG